jgi:peptidoglycan/LPS O-acetylase OafA/YrhL
MMSPNNSTKQTNSSIHGSFMQSIQKQESRILSLDALRGIAALIVLFAHLRLAFFPMMLSGSPPYSIARVPVCLLINGGASVALFFVLSGFVLTYRFFKSGNTTGLIDIIIRRWPRLAGPVVIVSLISGILMGFGFYHNVELASLNDSSWLKEFYTWKPKGFTDMLDALRGGVWGVFFTKECPYNMNFWTMHYELIGSIAAYLFALFVVIVSRHLNWRLVVVGMLLLWFREVLRFPYISGFLLGTLLAFLHHRFRAIIWREPISLILTAIFCVLAGGFIVPENDFPSSFYDALHANSVDGRLSLRYGLHSVLAVILLSYALWVPSIRAFLSRPLMRKLGHLSFPIYLIHLPLICSLGASSYLLLRPQGNAIAATLATLLTILATILCSLPLAWIDDHWLIACRRISPWQCLAERFRLNSGRSS